MDIVELAQDDSAAANSKMLALVTVHKNAKNLEPGDQKCLDAANSYRLKLQYDVRTKVRFNVDQIRAAIKEASATTDPNGAIPIYESILELYASFKWGNVEGSQEGRDLVQKTRELLGVMRAAKKNADDARQEAEGKAAQERLDKEKLDNEQLDKDQAEKEKAAAEDTASEANNEK